MDTKICTHCHKEFPVSKEYFPPDKHTKSGYGSWCRNCKCKLNRQLSNKYYAIPEHKYKRSLIHKAWLKIPKNQERQRELFKRWIINNQEQYKSLKIKQKAYRRNLGTTILYKNILDEPTVGHHINNNYIVYIPIDLHELYHGTRKYHRFMVNQIVEQIYNIKVG